MIYIRARICKRLRSSGIDSTSLCNLAGRYDKYGCPSVRQAGNRFLGSLKRFRNTGLWAWRSVRTIVFQQLKMVFWRIFCNTLFCHPSDSTVSEDAAGFEPRTVATLIVTVRRSNQSARSQPFTSTNLSILLFKNI
jgi:hypothetical protein